LLEILIVGAVSSAIYAMLAVGFTLIFGVLNVVNFAHGEVYMIGAYAGLLLITSFAPPLFAVIFGVLAVGALTGLGLERMGRGWERWESATPGGPQPLDSVASVRSGPSHLPSTPP